jgi:ubiquinone/menaquinone biosynthesis C-methylase UbiE
MEQQNWKDYWESKGKPGVSDAEFDRGANPRDGRIDQLASEELLEFIDCHPTARVFDAGCGSGVNISLLHSRVGQLLAMDYADSAMTRCRSRLEAHGIRNVLLFQGDVTCPPLPADSADLILCMSVLHYLDDEQVRKCLRAFARVLKNEGALILHVKNLSSLYLGTLWSAKQLVLLTGKKVRLEHFRTFRWYRNELQAAGFEVTAFNSFNLFMIERMPKRLVSFLQEVELKNRARFPFCTGFARRHGSDLKIRATLHKTSSVTVN